MTVATINTWHLGQWVSESPHFLQVTNSLQGKVSKLTLFLLQIRQVLAWTNLWWSIKASFCLSKSLGVDMVCSMVLQRKWDEERGKVIFIRKKHYVLTTTFFIEHRITLYNIIRLNYRKKCAHSLQTLTSHFIKIIYFCHA